ncbi:TPA: hypothetical protein ACUK3G_000660 [Escherichia coli]|nr:hypothetical protein [Escherichia coli]
MMLKDLVLIYGYDISVISRWQSEGLDLSAPDADVYKWVVENKITPLRKSDPALKSEKLREEIRLTKARADQQEIETKLTIGEVVYVNEVADELAAYCSRIRQSFRTLPVQAYMELSKVGDDGMAIKNKLQEYIDDKLLELGDFKYEERFNDETNENIQAGESGDNSTSQDPSE